MPNTQQAQDAMQKYIVVRNFHLGEAGINLSAGDKLSFDDRAMTLDKNGQAYEVPSLRLAIMAGHVVVDDGTMVFKKPVVVEKPKPTIIIFDQEDQVVAKIRLPGETTPGAKRTTEQVAKTNAATDPAPPRIVYEDQRVVGRAGLDARKPVRTALSDAEARETARRQSEEATVVKTGSVTRTRIQELMAQEGIGTAAMSGRTPVFDGDSDARVVARVRSAAEVLAEQKRDAAANRLTTADLGTTPEQEAALAADIKVAIAKREGRIPSGAGVATAPVDTVPTASSAWDADGWPVDYPRKDHWRKRLLWCQQNKNAVTAVKRVYQLSTESFQARLVKDIPEISFE